MSISRSTVVVPRELAEAVDLLAGPSPAMVCAGGTDLVPRLRTGEVPTTSLVLCGGLPELRHVTVRDEVLVLGAAATYQQLARSSELARHVPQLQQVVSTLANPRVRSRGTIGGHVCAARSRYDVMTLLVVLGARARIESTGTSRRVPVSELVLAERRTLLRPEELLTELEVPVPPPGVRVGFERLGTSQGPVVNVAAAVGPDFCRLVIGAVGPRTIELDGREALSGDLEALSQRASDAALTDAPGLASPWYRSTIAGVLTTRLLTRLLRKDDHR